MGQTLLRPVNPGSSANANNGLLAQGGYDIGDGLAAAWTMPVDTSGNPMGTMANPFFVSGTIGSAGSVSIEDGTNPAFKWKIASGGAGTVDGSGFNQPTLSLGSPNSSTTAFSGVTSSTALYGARVGRRSLTVYNAGASGSAYISEGIAAGSTSGTYSWLVPAGGTLSISGSEVFTGAYNYRTDYADGSFLNVTERW